MLSQAKISAFSGGFILAVQARGVNTADWRQSQSKIGKHFKVVNNAYMFAEVGKRSTKIPCDIGAALNCMSLEF